MLACFIDPSIFLPLIQFGVTDREGWSLSQLKHKIIPGKDSHVQPIKNQLNLHV